MERSPTHPPITESELLLDSVDCLLIFEEDEPLPPLIPPSPTHLLIPSSTNYSVSPLFPPSLPLPPPLQHSVNCSAQSSLSSISPLVPLLSTLCDVDSPQAFHCPAPPE